MTPSDEMTPEDMAAGEITGKWEHIIATKLHSDIADAIRQARREALEEAAREAEQEKWSHEGRWLAEAIRALKP